MYQPNWCQKVTKEFHYSLIKTKKCPTYSNELWSQLVSLKIWILWSCQHNLLRYGAINLFFQTQTTKHTYQLKAKELFFLARIISKYFIQVGSGSHPEKSQLTWVGVFTLCFRLHRFNARSKISIDLITVLSTRFRVQTVRIVLFQRPQNVLCIISIARHSETTSPKKSESLP